MRLFTLLCSKLASIFQNWTTNDENEGYLYTSKDVIKSYAKRDPDGLYYDIGMGRVDPAALKELYEEDRAKMVAKSESEKESFRRSLREEVEPRLKELYVSSVISSLIMISCGNALSSSSLSSFTIL